MIVSPAGKVAYVFVHKVCGCGQAASDGTFIVTSGGGGGRDYGIEDQLVGANENNGMNTKCLQQEVVSVTGTDIKTAPPYAPVFFPFLPVRRHIPTAQRRGSSSRSILSLLEVLLTL